MEEIKFELEQFINTVKDELFQYEDGEKLFSTWHNGFNELLEKNELSKINLKTINNIKYFVIYDELEIISIVEEFVESYDDNNLKDYFNTFK